MKTKTQGKTHSVTALRGKLLSATAMLLVSATMLVSSTYAWFVLSTAPEVTGIKTQVGANGALEIALLNGESWENLALLDMGDIDESVETVTTDANLTWGNLVNLDDAVYGMDKIVLNPARLNLTPDGSGSGGAAQYKVNTIPLKIPVYREDGRIEKLDATAAVTRTNGTKGFEVEDGYGVRAIGTVTNMSIFQQGMNEARSAIITNTSAARTTASSTLNATGGDLATIVVDHVLNGKNEGFTTTDATNIQKMAMGLKEALDQLEMALRATFAGYITTTAYSETLTEEEYQVAYAGIFSEETTLTGLMTTYSGITAVIPAMDTYVTKLTANQTAVQTAIDSCQAKIDAGATMSWDEIDAIISPLVVVDDMTLAGMSITEIQQMRQEQGDQAVVNLVLSNGLVIGVPSGSGVLSDIADFADNYTAVVTVKKVTAAGMTLENVEVTMVTQTNVSPVYLTVCNNRLRTATVADASENTAITDFYGYAIDLAFRTNAAESELLLQTDPQNRVYEGENQAALQGGGSYMSFTTSAGLSATKMVKLMGGIRVVFMDREQTVLAIAALDCTLGKDVYTVLDEADRTDDAYAYLNGGTGAYQKSDLISKEAYTALGDTSAVAFDPTAGTATAKLYLYDFSMPMSTVNPEERTGALQLNGRRNDAAITALEQDTVETVTALVYLDGSVVNNSSVAANSSYSMTGKLNLQFASSALLMPAQNSALRSNTDVVYTELSSVDYQAGYCYFGGALYRVNDGYKLYEGSDGKIYSQQTSSEEYTELTAQSGALTAVSATLTAGTDADGAVTLTAALSGTMMENLTVTKYELKKIGGEGEAAAVQDGNVFTLTGTTPGEITYQAILTVEVGTGEAKSVHTLLTASCTVTVTAQI